MVPELRPRGIGEMLDLAVALYRARFGQLALLAATVVVPVQVLSTIVLLSAQPTSLDVSVAGTTSPQYDTSSVLVGLAASLVVLFVGFVSNTFVIGVCARPVADAYIGHESTSTRGRIGGRGFGAVLAGATLVALCEIVGFGFCGFGTFVVAAFLAVALPALVLERVGPGAAIGRSLKLTKSYFFRVLGLIISAQLLVSVVNLGLAFALRAFLLSGASVTVNVIAQGIAGTIAAVLTTPLLATVAVVCYFDARIRNEGFDVQLLLQRNDARHAAARAAVQPAPAR